VWLLRGLAWWLLWQVLVRGWRKIWPRPRPRWLDWGLLARVRPLLWPADRLVQRLTIEPGMQIVDVGSGVGGLTDHLVRAVGPLGHVIAIDERLAVVEDVQLMALATGTANLTVLHAPPTLMPTEPGTIDLVVLTSVFGGVPDKQALVAEAYRVVRPGGAVAISEFLVDADYALASTVVTHLVLAGFGIEREVGGFAGYTVIGRKPRLGG
jgi:SAM-dependent methyltransferase